MQRASDKSQILYDQVEGIRGIVIQVSGLLPGDGLGISDFDLGQNIFRVFSQQWWTTTIGDRCVC